MLQWYRMIQFPLKVLELQGYLNYARHLRLKSKDDHQMRQTSAFRPLYLHLLKLGEHFSQVWPRLMADHVEQNIGTASLSVRLD